MCSPDCLPIDISHGSPPINGAMAGEHLVLHFVGPFVRWLRSIGPVGARRILVVLGIAWISGGVGWLAGPRRGDSLPEWHKRHEFLQPGTPMEETMRYARGALLLGTGVIVLLFGVQKRPSRDMTIAAKSSIVVANCAAVFAWIVVDFVELVRQPPARLSDTIIEIAVRALTLLLVGFFITFLLRLVRLHAGEIPK